MVSCTSNTIYKKPDDLITNDSMVLLLSDLYLATASKMYKNKLKERNIDYTFLVYEKYRVDTARFRRSNFYYTTKIDEYEKIYKRVEAKLKALNTDFKVIKKSGDSIRRDSILKAKELRNYLKKKKEKIKDSLKNLKIADSLTVEEILILTDSLIQADTFDEDNLNILNKAN